MVTSSDEVKKVVVVLGMHRSGTSLIAKSLETLGLNLQLNLEAGPDNPTGFWEDPVIKGINEALLDQLGSSWDSVRPFDCELLELPFVDQFFSKATIYLTDKVSNEKLWGFKDPRTCRLLPFWKKVFTEVGVEPRYLLIGRHPISVCSSLKKRNGFTDDKSYFLWSRYLEEALKGLKDEVCHLVLYERFLESPDAEVRSMSRFLEMPVDEKGYKQFLNSVLKSELQHSQYDLMSLPKSESLISELALSAYSVIAQETNPVNSNSVIARLQKSFFLPLKSLHEQARYQDLLSSALSIAQQSESEFLKNILDNRFVELDKALTHYQKENMNLLESYERVYQDFKQVASDKHSLSIELEKLFRTVEEANHSGQIAIESRDAIESENRTLMKEIEKISGLLEQANYSEKSAIEQRDKLQLELDRIIGEFSAYTRSANSQIQLLTRWLDRERFSVVKPLLRKLYYFFAVCVRVMPVPLQRLARKLRMKLFNISPVPLMTGNLTAAFQPLHGAPDIPKIEERSLLEGSLKNTGSDSYDVILFPVIDWDFRIQRPQHLLRELAVGGHRAIYLKTTFFTSSEPDYRVLDNPVPGLFVVELGISTPPTSIYHAAPTDQQANEMADAIIKLQNFAEIKELAAIVDLPFWRKTVEQLQGALVVYDCMDHHAGFENNSSEMLEEETALISRADLVISSSAKLFEELSQYRNDIKLIRNGAEVDYFKVHPPTIAWKNSRSVVGYYGAIAEWFDIDLLVQSAQAYPEWDFVMVGAVTGCDIREAKRQKNIHFIGEVPYPDLTQYLYAFDVCLIPFKIIELTLCTNPVKVYEYLAAGCPVVSTAMPEVMLLSEHVHVSESPDEFIKNIAVAMSEVGNATLSSLRAEAALEHDWSNRAEALDYEISSSFPLVSVIVLTFNNLAYTKACLDSLYRHTHYPNWEVIVVDNASSDDTQNYLKDLKPHHANMTLIFNAENLGFSAGNNVGLKAAKGDYLVVLNNDTYVSDGWLLGLIRHLKLDSNLGLVGPVTNNIGNEAKIDINYADMTEMHLQSRVYVRDRTRKLLPVNTVAFFCVAMSRAVYDLVGGLDEQFGLGFFEDDDYCNRVRELGYSVAVAEDVFVHHHLSASFDAIGEEKKAQLFAKNKALYEAKWGEWTPHTYR